LAEAAAALAARGARWLAAPARAPTGAYRPASRHLASSPNHVAANMAVLGTAYFAGESPYFADCGRIFGAERVFMIEFGRERVEGGVLYPLGGLLTSLRWKLASDAADMCVVMPTLASRSAYVCCFFAWECVYYLVSWLPCLATCLAASF
jgi:hypothetical protein